MPTLADVEPLRVEVRRGGVVEAVHRVHACVWNRGEIVASAGDPDHVTFYRSSSKPLQALPLVRARPELEGRLVAIACASHRDEPEQIDAVRALLAAADVSEDELECGSQEGRPPGPIHHNCSGKHAGFLAVCRTRGWPTRGYRLAGHPLQRELLQVVETAAGSRTASAVDGCGVPTFALTLTQMAASFSRLEQLDAGARIAAAMREHPQLVGGVDSLDTRLMRSLPGWIAKGGAEGLICGAGPDGCGLALKVEDGNQRALPPALAVFLPGLEQFARVPVTNVHGEEVGEVVAA